MSLTSYRAAPSRVNSRCVSNQWPGEGQADLFAREQLRFRQGRIGGKLVRAVERERLLDQVRQQLRKEDGRRSRLPEEESQRARTWVHLIEPDLARALVRHKVDPRRAGTAHRLEAFGGPVAQLGFRLPGQARVDVARQRQHPFAMLARRLLATNFAL